ncbi:DUF6176 family protein [Acidipropionibacterium timonense]|uniref:DUF6176 family protein n=1 Tax=Acidipropionibacterium timonense TaxID=2161818 RepID=UPI0010307D71|nr:DUF6176 family protein [Acidipropionibacterium timonense]
MPPSVPSGMRLELSRARVLPGAEDLAREWMDMLNRRQDECVKTLSIERCAFESWFLHTESDGVTWIYWFGLTGEGGEPIDVESRLDHDHMDYMRRVKEPGWEEMQPMFMLTPDHIRAALETWGTTGMAHPTPTHHRPHRTSS